MAHPKKNISYAPASEPYSVRMWQLLLRGFNEILDRVGGVTGTALPLRNYTVATLPDATVYTYSLIIVTNETGGCTVAFNDGSGNWRRVQDRAIVS